MILYIKRMRNINYYENTLFNYLPTELIHKIYNINVCVYEEETKKNKKNFTKIIMNSYYINFFNINEKNNNTNYEEVLEDYPHGPLWEEVYMDYPEEEEKPHLWINRGGYCGDRWEKEFAWIEE